MSTTTNIRINWPVSPVALLDHVTRVAGGDPDEVLRVPHLYEWEGRGPDHELWNLNDQGLSTWASVAWSVEGLVRNDADDENTHPPALVILTIDNTGPEQTEIQADLILPAVAEWLSEQGVPVTAWFWEDECMGSWHPGSDAAFFRPTFRELREVWTPSILSTEGH